MFYTILSIYLIISLFLSINSLVDTYREDTITIGDVFFHILFFPMFGLFWIALIIGILGLGIIWIILWVISLVIKLGEIEIFKK